MSDAFSITVPIAKADPETHMVRGWASVVERDGRPVIDGQGDVIALDDLRAAAHRFVAQARVSKAQHRGEPIGEVVESVIVDDDFAAAHGITHGDRCWWIGVQIHDPATWAKVEEGVLKSFSLGGKGRRTPLPDI